MVPGSLRNQRRDMQGTDDPIDIGRINVNATIRDLMEVAMVAIPRHRDEVTEAEAVALLTDLLAVVDRAMPAGLQQQDPRVISARVVLHVLKPDED